MSFICNSTPSTSGSLVSKVAHRQVLAFLYPIEVYQHKGRPTRRRVARRNPAYDAAPSGAVEAWFISSLARAGNCPQHITKASHTSSFFTASRPESRHTSQHHGRVPCRRFQHTKNDFTFSRQPLPKADSILETSKLGENAHAKDDPSKSDRIQDRTREELLDMVDQYGGDLYTEHNHLLELPSRYQPSDGPHLTVSDKPADEWPPPRHTWPADRETKIKLQFLDMALIDRNKDPEEIFQLYRDLPGPRVPYIEASSRHKLLHHLGVVEKKDEHSMLRYLSVVDDMKNTAIPLTTSEWTTAISFVSRYVTSATEIEVEAALHMWREMEHVANVKANGATFNVLFDVACKAGKFTLAEMIYKEMEKRSFEFNRFHHVSLIYYYGLKQNGDGARAAYRELVAAGEMVDTVIMNAMISALIRSREPDAAENIYQRMKSRCLEDNKLTPPPKNFKARRVITGTLRYLAIRAREYPDQREELQKRASLVPDNRTYQILINHFAVNLGDLAKTTELLNDRKIFDLPVQGALFLSLFKSFAIHGGVKRLDYTEWTEARLESVLKAFLDAVQEETEGLYVSKWMVVWILRAFARCSGKERMQEVWRELDGKWKGRTEHDNDFVMVALKDLTEREEEMEEKGWDWELSR